MASRRPVPKVSAVEESIYNLVSVGTVGDDNKAPIAPMRRDKVAEHIPTAVHRGDKDRASIAQHRDSSQVTSLLNPVRGVRDQMERNGVAPRNHAKDNARAIKELSSKNHLKKLEAEQSKNQPKPLKPARARVPSAREDDDSRNFINENIREAVNKPAGPRASSPPPFAAQAAKAKHSNFGAVPDYIKLRKAELANIEDQRRAAAEAEEVPPGMMLLTEEERLRMLGNLNTTKKQVETDLQKMPFNVETPSQIKYKTGLETKLKEVEDAIKVFSRKKVYVKKNS
mmetsp:Transcript_38645/g.46788  ORF Transcript_38645/g.46788 Transcript_38645/m.46788 type:complete len:284 (+) Transcript_38645:263-1114(+)|eukprot:CAMPEP_0197848954 /NCGR_PEP_ID=MMETSP1438-20131217/10557_1 /TAXON_ID=1461541 /ORGANISM="Pterosperma sp., Strain CCMP1384" /LENGTH=283 /DNA_ID=CAMNT_0043461437 /DNA_START=247 /DNA_END=1098 /DNA_ORIENTATION=-